jgi:tetratricopeptide (TPR) repeat protein
LSHAVVVVPGSPVLRMAYADYQYRHRRLTDAEKNYRRALDLGGDPVEAYTGIGLAQYAGGSFEGAMQSWEEADIKTGHSDPHLAGYLALANARLQYRASCRNAVRRLKDHPDVLEEFRTHPDWKRVRHLTGEG